ncbi:MAG TPA: transaldolase family protein [Candidatus Limnocylindrales bacterium]|jgi:transaldolase
MTGLASAALVDCPMSRTVSDRPTDYWNDSCAIAELEYAVARGATGATSNPSIVLEVLGKERAHWQPWVAERAMVEPSATETDLTWALIEAMAARGAGILEPVFVREGGRKGRLSIQTNPANHGNAELMLEQGRRFAALAPNMQVKFPATAAGIAAIEAATAAGISINATVCFTVAQAIAVAEAVERGLDALVAGGGDAGSVSPVCTIMMGRVDDWLRVLVERDGIVVQPDALDWAGIAVFKRAYAVFRERGYRARLLAAAYRHRLHWTELVGGDVILTLPHAWQVRFNASGITPVDRIDEPVEPRLVDDLLERLPDFERAYDPMGLTIDEFQGFGATARTLRTFIRSYHDLIGAVRDIVLPDPDVRPS